MKNQPRKADQGSKKSGKASLGNRKAGRKYEHNGRKAGKASQGRRNGSKKTERSSRKSDQRRGKAEMATSIYPMENIPKDEFESKKIAAFYHAVDLMKQEGYVLRKDLSAVHEDADKPFFKAAFCKNGWELRRITNITGWMVIIRYQRYRTRQHNKVRGVEKSTEFEVIEPRKQHHSKATKETVKELYNMGNTVSQIIRAYEIQRGIILKPGTVRNWVSEVARKTKEIEVDIFELEKAMQKMLDKKINEG